MAIIQCSECGKDISDKAASCPNCGNPINNTNNEEYLCCPKCRSKELHAEHKGFSGGKALTGALLTGGIGLLAGTIGSKDVQITCLKCNNKFKAGEAITIYNNNSNNVDDEILSIVRSKGKLEAVKFYKNKMNCDLPTAKRYIDSLTASTNARPSNNGGCTSVVLIALIILSILIMI